MFEPDGPKPRSVAIIHCVGSRDRNHNRYCSRVCCMYSLKFAHLVKEKLPGAECHEYYIDMRAYGKGYEEFLERIREEGIHVVRGRSAEVVSRDGQLVRPRRGRDRRQARREPGGHGAARGRAPAERGDRTRSRRCSASGA